MSGGAGAAGRRRAAEARRLQAAEYFAAGLSQAEVARRLRVSAQAVSVWHRSWRAGGPDALRATAPGRKPWLSSEQIEQLARVLQAGPQAAGFTGGWTLARVAVLIRRLFGVAYRHPAGVWKLLHRMGWSAQRPARRAMERDEDAIATWREVTWPAIVKPPTPRGPSSSSPTNPASA